MIYNILNNFFQSARKLWQFWNAKGFNFMTLALPNPDRGIFFNDSENEALDTATSEEKVLAKRRKVTYSEILTYALPGSQKVAEFNDLIEQVLVSQKQTSLVERDDSVTAEAMILFSDILTEHWQDFSIKVKVLLLNKLKVYKKTFWQYILSYPANTFNVLTSRATYYRKFWRELKTYDSTTQRSILDKFSKDMELLKSAWNTLEETRLIILEKDEYLLEENKENIGKFSHSIKTMIAGRYLINKYSEVLIELAK